jgi:hypothetical protein
MKIAKYILLKSQKDFIKSLDNIYKNLSEIIKKQYPNSICSLFRLDLDFIDEKIEFTSYNEFDLNKEGLNLKNLIGFFFRIIFKKDEKTHNEFLFSFFYFTEKNNLPMMKVEIEFDEWNKELSKDIFDKITNSIPYAMIYKFNPKLENKQRIKNKINKCISILENLNRYQLRMKSYLKDEKELQDFIFPILKSHFEDLEDEFNLPRFGNIEYKPDFGISNIGLLIECKFLRNKKDLKKIQKEIHDDIIGYLKSSKQYQNLIFFVYNSKNIPVPDKFVKDIEKIKGVESVIIVPGVYPK